MPETCYVCEYKRLAREAIEDYVTLVGLLDLLDKGVGQGWKRQAAEYKCRFLDLHTKQGEEENEQGSAN